MNLPEPKIVDTEGPPIAARMVARFEELTGRPLAPSQVEWVVLQVLAYEESLLRIQMNQGAKQNLVRFAEYPMLDHLGVLVALERLPAQYAITTMQFSIEEPLGVDTLIPTGNRSKSKDGVAVFAIDEDATIVAGQTQSNTVPATATTTGLTQNGYLEGQLSEMVDQVAGVTCQNLSQTSGGAPQETTVRMRERFRLAPDAASTAGGEAGYRFWALSASQVIEDVAVLSPAPNQIDIVLLDDGGNMTPEIQALVLAKLTPDTVRPQNDEVTCRASDSDDFTIEAELTLYKDADPTTALALANERAQAFIKSRRKLNLSATRGQIATKLSVPGVHSVNLIEPATDIVPGEDSWARCTGVDVSVAGFSEELTADE